MLHLGLGAFHRAHQAVVLQRLIEGGDTDWHIAAGNICPGQEAVEAALLDQAGVYTVENVAPDGRTQYQRVQSIRTVLPYEPGLASLIELGARPSTRILSFTVTEAGYAPGPGNALFPVLAAILRKRRRFDAGKLSLLCCDNLRHNGQVALAGLLDHLEDDALLRDWVLLNTSWPSCMVDRITPRTPPELRARVFAATGKDDAAPVMAESWLQWVIEDEFCNGRPAWEQAGVQMVGDVAAYEEAKIRILNAGHSAIAWAGTLLGHRFIHEAVLDPRVRRIAHDYITEQVLPCLVAKGSLLDLAGYRDSVLARFGNAALGDTCRRVIADSGSKLAGFIVPTLRERLAAGADIASGALLPALMLMRLQRWHSGELDDAYEDQSMETETVHAICAAADPVMAFAANQALWGDLAGNARLVDALRSAMERLPERLAA
ncbi:mannitol dehydrogenase family protein [Pelomonas sp. SE-A7]|uniref:mannitol dehydrogenase family protein n=1 Tax=Pelomonas sp. SE-A7 TaxID=3054953 RepID=UPI00259D1CDD|nr:mannitol dehydrogenase family protein [Pelomonas sp. SE-A7]MDM4766315.1 mannitol dehydrogenase family protein [Pelomonas sp. SE-A7]